MILTDIDIAMECYGMLWNAMDTWIWIHTYMQTYRQPGRPADGRTDIHTYIVI